jgi:hypothetical protein
MVVHAAIKKDIPTSPHWAILKFSTLHIPGDERSRTHPGHGYPGSIELIIRYQVYTDKKEWEGEILKLVNANDNNFLAVEVRPAQIDVQVVVQVT